MINRVNIGLQTVMTLMMPNSKPTTFDAIGGFLFICFGAIGVFWAKWALIKTLDFQLRYGVEWMKADIKELKDKGPYWPRLLFGRFVGFIFLLSGVGIVLRYFKG